MFWHLAELKDKFEDMLTLRPVYPSPVEAVTYDYMQWSIECNSIPKSLFILFAQITVSMRTPHAKLLLRMKMFSWG